MGNSFFSKALMGVCLVLMAALLLAGCGGSSGAERSTNAAYDGLAEPATGAMGDGEMYTGEAAPAMAPQADEGGGVPTVGQPGDDRKIILTAWLSVEAVDFDESLAALNKAVDKAGGYVSATDVSGNALDGNRSASLTYRIPADTYSEFVQNAGDAGNLVSRSESSEDVSAHYVDVQARLASLRTQEERLMALMEESGSLEELLMVQDQLANVQYEIESYTATQRGLDNRISYATVTVSLYEVQQPTEAKPTTFGERVSQAFTAGWKSAGNFFQGLFVRLVYALPLLLFLLVAGLIVLVVVLRVHKRNKAKAAKAPPPPSWPPSRPQSAAPPRGGAPARAAAPNPETPSETGETDGSKA